MSESSNDPPGGNPYGQQPPAYTGGQPYGQTPYGQPRPTDPDKRPGTVTAAAILTIAASSIGLLLFGVFLIALLAVRDEVIEEIDNELADQRGMEDFSGDDLANVLIVAMAVFMVWCLIAIVTGVLSLRRKNWARIVTVVSAAVSVVFSLLAIGSVVSIIPLLAAGAAIVLYFVGGANDWYARRQPPSPPPAGQWG